MCGHSYKIPVHAPINFYCIVIRVPFHSFTICLQYLIPTSELSLVMVHGESASSFWVGSTADHADPAWLGRVENEEYWNISPDEGSALLLSQSGSIDRAAEAKLEAWSWSTCWSLAWLTHSLVHSGKISIELFIWLLSHHSIWYYWSILFDLNWWIIDRVLEAGVVYLLELLTGAVIFRKQN